MSNSTLEYKFRAVNDYDVILSGVKDAQCFNLTINITTKNLTLYTFNKDLDHLRFRGGNCDDNCVNSIINFINNYIKTSLGFIISGQTIIFKFQEKESNLKIGNNSILINPKVKDIIKSMYGSDIYYSGDKMYHKYLLSDARGMNGYQEKENFYPCFDKIESHVGGKQEGGKKKSRKSKTRKITKKSKARKMTGGENEESKTFTRKKIGSISTPYTLKISTDLNSGTIKLTFTITSSNLPLIAFTSGITRKIKARNQNKENIETITNFFSSKIKTNLGFIKKGQIINFIFDLKKSKGTIEINEETETKEIKVGFKDIMFDLFTKDINSSNGTIAEKFLKSSENKILKHIKSTNQPNSNI
jgi:hypothetical protein